MADFPLVDFPLIVGIIGAILFLYFIIAGSWLIIIAIIRTIELIWEAIKEIFNIGE